MNAEELDQVEFEDFEQEAYDDWIERGLDPEDFTLAAAAALYKVEDDVEEKLVEAKPSPREQLRRKMELIHAEKQYFKNTKAYLKQPSKVGKELKKEAIELREDFYDSVHDFKRSVEPDFVKRRRQMRLHAKKVARHYERIERVVTEQEHFIVDVGADVAHREAVNKERSDRYLVFVFKGVLWLKRLNPD